VGQGAGRLSCREGQRLGELRGGPRTRDDSPDVSPSVFISHSCKDLDDPTDQQRDAAEVRDAIAGRLKARGWDVLLDQTALKPGMPWRAQLNRWLGVCDAGVLILHPGVMESDWVRKEAAILGWRRALGSGLLLTPVFLGGFTTSELAPLGISQFDINEIQAARPGPGELGAEELERLVDTVATSFAASEIRPEDTAMSRWLRRVRELLELALSSSLEDAAEALAVEPQEWADEPARARIVALYLLYAETQAAYDALTALKAGMADDRFRQLAEAVLPIWVPGEAAAHLRALLGVGPKHTVLVNVDDREAVQAYVRRAECKPLIDGVFVWPSPRSGEGGHQEVFESILRGFDRGGAEHDLGVLENKLRDSLAQRYIVLRPSEASVQLLEEIRRRLPQAHVLVAGSDVGTSSRLVDGVLVEPEADEPTIKDGQIFIHDVNELMRANERRL
jgi:hypothetical protein